MNKKIIIAILLIIIISILGIIFIPKLKGNKLDMKEIYNINKNRRYENW